MPLEVLNETISLWVITGSPVDVTQLSLSVDSLVVDVCSGERLVVSVDMESATFDEVPKSLDRLVDRKRFSVDSTVLSFGVFKLLVEESNGLPVVVDVLLQDSTSTDA